MAGQPIAADEPLVAHGPLARVPPTGLVLGAITSVQFGSATATRLFSAVGPGGAVLLRLVSASVVLGVLGRRGRAGLASVSRRDRLLVVAFGLILGGMNLSFYYALRRLPLGAAVTLEFLGPLGVAIVGSRRRRDLAWALLAAAGVLALGHGVDHGLDGFGVVLVLCAALFWAAYILVNAQVGQAFAGGSGLAAAMIVATFVALPFGLLDGGSALFAPRSLALGAAVGMLSSAIPYSCEIQVLRRMPVNVFGVLMSLEPAMAALAGFLVIGQGVSALSLVGILLVGLASAGASLS